jgi:RNA-binding protein
MSLALTARQRSALKARAHALEPIVQIGQAGLSDAVVAEADRALTAHGLIKVRIGAADRESRAELTGHLCARTEATLVQTVGKVAVVWRPRPDDPPL